MGRENEMELCDPLAPMGKAEMGGVFDQVLQIGEVFSIV